MCAERRRIRLNERLRAMLPQELGFLNLGAPQLKELLAAGHGPEPGGAVEAHGSRMARQDPERRLAETLCLQQRQCMRKQRATQALVPGVGRSVEGPDLSPFLGGVVVPASTEADECLHRARQFGDGGGRLRRLKNVCPRPGALIDGQACEEVFGQKLCIRRLPRTHVGSGDGVSVGNDSVTDVHATSRSSQP